jgi:hypothetical protein
MVIPIPVGGHRKEIKDNGPVMPIICPHCNNQKFWHYIEINKSVWLGLPLIPLKYSGTHCLICPICHKMLVMNNDEQVDITKQLCATTKNLLVKKITNEEYNETLTRAKLLETFKPPYDKLVDLKFEDSDSHLFDQGPAVQIKCPNCNNAAWFHLLGEANIKKDRYGYLSCEICSNKLEIYCDQVDDILKLLETTRSYINKQMSKESYQKIISESQFFKRDTQEEKRKYYSSQWMK